MILVIDKPLPSIYAQWRIEEVRSFIIEKGADVASMPSKDNFYPEMRNYYGLNDEYNIFIFNRKLNHLNVFNKNIDGTLWNGKFPLDFVASKKLTFDINSYDAIYHMFYSRYKYFNESAYPKFPKNKQFVHLYPGGHIKDYNNIEIDKNTNIITTQKYVTEKVREQKFNNFTEVTGGSFLQKNNVYKLRDLNKDKLTVCYSSFGKPKSKGGDIYTDAARIYKQKYPNDNIIFYGVGNCVVDDSIKYLNYMTMENLKIFYDGVDIYVNPERGRINNGWPIGVEAMLRGSVLITTDPNNVSGHYTFGDDVLKIKNEDASGIVNHIKMLYDDRKLLKDKSNTIQKKVNVFYSFENQQKKIYDFIDNTVGKVV